MATADQKIADCIKRTRDYGECVTICPDSERCQKIKAIVIMQMINEFIAEEERIIQQKQKGDRKKTIREKAEIAAAEIIEKYELPHTSEDKDAFVEILVFAYEFAARKSATSLDMYFFSMIREVLEEQQGQMLRALSSWERQLFEMTRITTGQEIAEVDLGAAEALKKWTPFMLTFGKICFFYGFGAGKYHGLMSEDEADE